MVSFLTKLFEFLTLVTLIVQQRIEADVNAKQSGKLDDLDAAILVMKTSRDPEERKNAALAIAEARKR